MKKQTKIWLITATALIVTGLILFSAVMTVYNWDFKKLSTEKYETKAYEISEDFSNIKINTDTADVVFAASDDGICKVVCYQNVKIKHSVYAEDGTLNICSTDKKKWYMNIGISFISPKITVYLPKSEYNTISVKESTGDITLKKLSADTVDLSVSTGEIFISDVNCKNIKSGGSTGDITLKNVNAEEKISLKRNTGDIKLQQSLAKEISLKASTGDIKLDRCDAADISVKTSTGNVNGTLLSEKVYKAHSDTGNVNVPKSSGNEKCSIQTDTGDIVIKTNK